MAFLDQNVNTKMFWVENLVGRPRRVSGADAHGSQRHFGNFAKDLLMQLKNAFVR